jgi:hypothetical protein
MGLFKVLYALSAILNATVSNSVTDCSQGTSVFKFTGGSLLPDPVVPGEDSSITLMAEIPAGSNVNAGTAKYSFSFNGIPFSPTIEDLCSDVACPLLPGPYKNTTTSIFPSGVRGKVVTRIEWFDISNNRLLCADVTAKV